MKSDFESEDKVHYLMYNTENGVILGISHSCYTSFGIPAAFVFGNASNSNELTLDQIAPELVAPKAADELKNTQGLNATLDTTVIQQHYFLGDDDSELEGSESEKEKDEEDMEIDHFNYSIDKKNRYRVAKIRALVISEEEYDDVSLKVLKFIEVDEGEENDKITKAKIKDEKQ